MISNELRKKQNKQLLKDEITKILDKDQGTFLKVKDIADFTSIIKEKIDDPTEDARFFSLEDKDIEDITKNVLSENRSVKVYMSSVNKISINQFLNIEQDKYILYMSKVYGLISNKRIEHIYLQMPDKMKKNYAFKQLNREAYNKHVRFAKDNKTK